MPSTSPPTSYRVGIDLGTTYSAAAVHRDGEPRPETVPLGASSAAVASMVFVAPDGSMLFGEAALRRSVTDPRQVVREFKRRIGDDTPLVVGGRAVAPETVAARFVAWILDRVAQREGGPAAGLALTHPAEWGRHKRDSVATALAAEGITDLTFLSEPEAAAVGYASTERVDVGAVVAVYDLGGGTFDAAVVRKLPDGGFEVAGLPVGIERLGGVDFDEIVFDHVRVAVGDAWDRLDPTDPAVQSAVAGLRRECTAAKEALSADTEVMIPVMLPGHHTQVRLGRAEFEEQIRPAVADTVEALRRAIDAAGVAAADLDAVLMVGGSSRIPLITQLVSAELGRPIAVDADPKSVIAVGAAVAARGRVSGVGPTGDAGPTAVDVDRSSPASPPSDLRPVFGSGGPISSPQRRPRTLAAAAALLVAVVIGVVGALGVAGIDPTGADATEVIAAATAPEPAAAAEPAPVPEPQVDEPPVDAAVLDPWTGTAPTGTTLPGPQRPQVAAAAQRPATRLVRNGSAASRSTRPTTTDRIPPVDPAPVVGPVVPPRTTERNSDDDVTKETDRDETRRDDPDPSTTTTTTKKKEQPESDEPDRTEEPDPTGDSDELDNDDGSEESGDPEPPAEVDEQDDPADTGGSGDDPRGGADAPSWKVPSLSSIALPAR